jgi:hypothetical protein
MRKKRPTKKCAGPSEEMREIFKNIRASLGRLEEGDKVAEKLESKIDGTLDEIGGTLDNIEVSVGGFAELTRELRKEVQSTHELLKKLTPPEDAPEDLSGPWTKCPNCGHITFSRLVVRDNMICRRCGKPYYPRLVPSAS